ncbi:hypothetical protein [Sphingomonas sp. 28-63-12]|uniref:hypothetical protein n=1 Tax=Sphingomonas sp. 28-63-12 TaxID=1970434 RepID=UPI000BD75E57|nr:MAG: hypothetical protein B7Y47_04745 [Sphingomonas sp. 28-63-12]
MKLTAFLSAALFGAAAMLSPTAASAQQPQPQPMQHEQMRHQNAVHTERRVVVTHRTRTVRSGNGWGHYRTRRVCKVTYRHHRRVRTCRTIRVRY